MLIYYLTGYPPRTDTGGGGLANNSLISKGIELEHTIEVFSKEADVPVIEPDLYWLSNMNGRFSLEFIREVTDNYRIPIIVQDDGYQNLCPQPTSEYKLCFQDRYYDSDWNIDLIEYGPNGRNYTYSDCGNICRYSLMGELLSKCKACVCVSPMHGNIWGHIFPQIKDRIVIVEPQINVDLFKPTYDMTVYHREPNWYLYVGTIARGKGFDKCVEYVEKQGKILLAAGDIHHTIDRSEVINWCGSIPQDKLPYLYSRCGYFIHLPDWPEPQGRCITEALLCGCTVITNDKCGAISYPWIKEYCEIKDYYITGLAGKFHMINLRNVDKFTDRIRNAPGKFWDDLGEYVGS